MRRRRFILPALLTSTPADDFYDRVNHRATSALARAISRGATKHLVFISSIAAQSGSYADQDLTEDDFPTPNNALWTIQICRRTGDTRGRNFVYNPASRRDLRRRREGKLRDRPPAFAPADSRFPSGALSAQRSVLSIQNFTSAVATALSNPRAQAKPSSYPTRHPCTVAHLIARHRASTADHPGCCRCLKAGSS
jgi:UDP-glucose 4-epimerase